MKLGCGKKFFKRNVWLAPGNFVWLSLSVLFCCFSAHSQEAPIVQIPGQGTPAEQQLPGEQLPGSVSGSVIDATGAIVMGARVTLTRGDQSPPVEAVSGSDGLFSFVHILPGTLQIKITAAGFAEQTSSVTLHSGEIYAAPPIKLVPATVGTEIEVTVPRVEVAEAQIKEQEKQRLIGVVPNFYISYIADAAPLNSRQKMQLAWKSTFDPVTIGFTAGVAGVQQAQNSFSGYGQGAQGYAKRFGANFTDNVTSTFIGSAILPALLRQDPRYFYKGTGSIRSRIFYAMANAVICKGDSGHWQPNYSGIGGGIISGAISNLYYPASNRGEALVFENTLIGTGETAILNIFQEFFSRKVTPHVPNYQQSQPPPRPTGNPRVNP